MLQFFKNLFAADFVPHGYCMRWSSDVVWLHVVSDAVIALAYYIIPFALLYFVRKRKDLAFHWMFVAFGIFILACGATHVMSIVTLWYPVYRIDGVIKAITALASILTAVMLVRLVPLALALPSPDDLEKEIARRREAEENLRVLNVQLENKVRERTVRLQRYTKALQRIAYISSHDLSEPVRTVVTFTQLLQRRCIAKLADQDLDVMNFVINGALRMDQLIKDLSDYTVTLDEEDGVDIGVTGKAVQAGTALQSAVSFLSSEVLESGAEVVSKTELPEVMANAKQLQLVFRNLIGNAIKFRNPAQSLRIEIAARRQADELIFEIRDNGIGLEMKYQDLIFEAFKRLHGAEIPGSGVGLAICKNLLESWGGRIWVESEGPGKGSTFYFALPAAPVPVTLR